MKTKIIKTLVLITAFMLIAIIPIPKVEAASFTVSKTNVSVEIGKAATITVNASTHTGRINVTSSNTSVATVSSGSFWVENNSQTFTISGKAEGTATITVQGELYDSSTEEEKVFTKTINVTVTKPVVAEQPKPSTNGGTNQGTSSSGTTSKPSTNQSSSKKTTSSSTKSSNASSNQAKSGSQNANNINPITSTEPILDDESIIEEPIQDEQNTKEEELKQEEQPAENEAQEQEENKQKNINLIKINKNIMMIGIGFIAGLVIAFGIMIIKKILRK